ncbi:otoancorin-like, partial [Polymixia lowei]
MSMEDRMATENGNLFSMFVSLLATLPVQDPESGSRNPPGPLGPETSVCFVRGFIAPLSWKILTTRGDRMDEETYGAMSWAARPLLQTMPPSKLNLPPMRQLPHLAKMMRMLKSVFGALSENQRVQVRDWVKEQISQNYFNCTLNARGPRSRPMGQKSKVRPTRLPGGERPTRLPGGEGPTRPSGGERPTRPEPMVDRCPRKLMWLEMEALKLMGPYLSRLKLRDVKSSSKDQLCEFFKSPQFKPAFRRVAGINPYLARRFLQRVQECYDSKAEFTQQLDSLGILGCFYKDTQSLNASVSMSLLSQLGDCTNSGVKRLRKRLVKTIMSSGDTDLMGELGASVAVLSPKQLSKLPIDALRSSLQAMGPDVTWKPKQAKRLAKKLLAGKTEVSSADLLSLGPAVKGVPPSMLKKVKLPKGTSKQDLRDMTKKMTKGQKKALMKGLRKSVKPSELLNQMPDSLLATLPLNILDKANITSLDQVEGKDWSRVQAAHLIKKMMANKVKAGDIRRLGSAMQGLTCKMINRVANNESGEMAQAMTDSPQWLSKAQAGCAARKLFMSLEEERADYFQTVTEEELSEIPTILLIRLSPGKIKGLPDSVCTAFLDKMSVANLSSLPPRAPSRPALTNRAVLCLANGGDLSGLSSDEVLALGPLLCEVPPAKLRLLDTDTLNSSLQAMASCRHIPPAHRAALVALVKETFGDPSDWSMEIMETLSPLLLLDAATISPLRFKSWLKEVLADLKDSLSRIFLAPPPGVKALKKKIFSLTFGGSGARRKREVRVSEMSQGNKPTEEMIEDLEDGNIHWSPEQLQQMTTETFVNSLETLSSIPDFSAEQLAALREKVIEAMGPVAGLNESQVSDLGCVSQCLSDSELRVLSVSLDTVEDIEECGWNQEQ